MTLEERLAWMQEHGTSVTLAWSEDDVMWECSWITGGQRFTKFAVRPDRAVWMVILAVHEAFPDSPYTLPAQELGP